MSLDGQGMAVKSSSLASLVADFRRSVLAFERSLRSGSNLSHKYAKDQVAAFNKLISHGDRGREALCVLLDDPDGDVRGNAAAFLLRYKPKRAAAVLRELARGDGMTAFCAEQSLERWKEGTSALDPVNRKTRRPHERAGSKRQRAGEPSKPALKSGGPVGRSAPPRVRR
jgi:hypothetical protein